MTEQEISALLDGQRKYYQSGATLPIKFRIAQLKKLYAAVKKYEAEIISSLNADLGKSSYESFMCEVGLALSEIGYMIKKTKSFAKPKKVRTPLAQFPSRALSSPSPTATLL